jgi:hypothetical protein
VTGSTATIEGTAAVEGAITFPGTNIPIPPVMTPADVARLFCVDPKTVTRWRRDGKLHGRTTIGGHGRFDRDHVVEVYQQHMG